MKFYTKQHKYYCGVDLHARSLYVCIIDQKGEIVKHKNIDATREAFLKIIKDCREDVVVAVECMFAWYWLADLCQRENIPFVLGHALYMKAIHGGKAKNDRIDAHKIAALLRGGGMIPMAYIYPSEMRATRDLLRRRNHLMRKRADLLAHIQNTNHQYNLPKILKNVCYRGNRTGLAERFEDECVRKSMEVNISLIDHYDHLLKKLEYYMYKKAKVYDPEALYRIQSIPGIGQTLAMIILYEIHDIKRFPRVQDYVSYCRLVKPAKESAGKIYGHSGGKIGNAHLKWAYSEAAVLFLRKNPEAMKYKKKLEKKHGKAKALSILAHKLGRATYYILKRREVFNLDKFLNKQLAKAG
ncbi:transposase IS116/IS110/IS902 family protein [bacterium BMS3Abin10]|nr:transposase IS116/IS110/IS902 family protein [bacterium BMS3Abin10]GBE37608.1 transposase IS116/IS110/IS902 family protein [bacterium BMS3Bbin08]